MTWLDWLIYPPLVLALVFPLAIQYERGGWWNLALVIAIPALVLDVILNHTTLALLTLDFPQSGEHTFSQRLKRLQRNTDWRGGFAQATATYLNYYTPGHKHV